MAYHPHDRQFLPEAQQRAQESHSRGGIIRCIHYRHLRAVGYAGHSALWSQCPECLINQCCIQHLLLPAPCCFCRLFLWCLRTDPAFFMEQQDRPEVGKHQRYSQHLPHGIHLGTGVVLMHRPHHRIPAGGCQHPRQPVGSHYWYAWLCHCLGYPLHPLCPLPEPAEISPQVRWMDEHGESGTGIHRIGIRLEIPLRSRPRLWLAHPRPRSVYQSLDCHFWPAGHLPLWLAQIPSR